MNKHDVIYEEIDISNETKTEKTQNNLLIVKKDEKDIINELENKVKDVIVEKYEKELKTNDIKRGSIIEQKIKNTVIKYFEDNKDIIFDPISYRAEFINNFMLNLSGYGVLQPLMDDDEIEDIYIYSHDKIWYSKAGEKFLSNVKFDNKDKFKAYIDNLLSRIGRNVNNRNPIEDGRMPDGSRIAVSADVLSPGGYSMSIRKFKKERITLDKLVQFGEIDEQTKNILIKVVKSRMNFLVSGGTSSGKTTMLNAMSQYIDEMDNVCTIEDNIELQLNREFWLQLESRKSNLEGEGEITMEDLLVHLLRRSPDRIVVGEIRTPGVANTFLSAVNTGHSGTCATIHADDPQRCRTRLCKLAASAANEDISSAFDDFDHTIHIIIQLKKHEMLHKRICTEISWVDESGKLIPIVYYDIKQNKFIHKELPEKMKNIFEEYGL